MNPNPRREPASWRVLDGVFSGIDVIDIAGEIVSFASRAVGFVLSSLLELLSGL